MSKKRMHMCLDIRGALRNGKRHYNGAFQDEDGRVLSWEETQDFLFDCLAKGWKVIPLTHKPCEGFSYETGCPGHPMSDESEQPDATLTLTR